MIPTMADDTTLGRYVDNIVAVWRRATPEQMTRGRAWYRTANDLATLISDGNTRAGAGVLAALSPHKAWDHTVRLARDAFSEGQARGHVRDALDKAERIMLGEDPLSVLPTDSKTWNFFRAIVDPDDAEAVVVDRHAHDIAAGERYGEQDRGLSNRRRYATLALAYRLAAQQLDEIPSTVQAVTWVVWREDE
jgi:hypothetical protein